MTNKQTTRRLFTILLMLMLGTFCPAALVRAQKPAAAKASSPSGPKEGIKVHGRWTIDIRNPDGKLVSHREFENALTPGGAEVLGLFLRRTSMAGRWRVQLNPSSTSPGPPCIDSDGGPAVCFIHETGSPFFQEFPNIFKTLTISSDGGTLLVGTATAQRTGDIARVQTILEYCPVGTEGFCD